MSVRSTGRPGLALLATAFLVLGTACSKSTEEPRHEPRYEHILLLTVDTLRSDYLSINGYDLPTTPFLDTLLAGGVLFPHAMAPVPRTTQSLASLLTGAYPHGTGVRTLYDSLNPGVLTLAELLRGQGYRTVAVVSNHVLVPERGLGRGFELYDAADDARDAQTTTEAALRHIAGIRREEKLFLWVHYIDPHVPYMPPRELAEEFDPNYRGRYAHSFGGKKGGVGDDAYPVDLPKAVAVYQNPLPSEVNAHVRRLYAADIRSTDDQIARLVEGLRSRLRNDWLVVFTADHGESLGEHDFFYDHGDYVYDSALLVPLAFVLPPGDSRARSAVVRDRVSLVDVFPTLAELLQLDLPTETAKQVEGRSLLLELEGRAPRPRPVFAESGRSFFPHLVRRRTDHGVAGRFRAVVLDDWKLIWTPGQAAESQFELYDLTRDPGETRNLYRADHPRLAALREALRLWYRPEIGEATEPTSEDLERLRSLGYLP